MKRDEKMKACDQRFQNYLNDMVTKYGEGSIITYKQAKEVYNSGDYSKCGDFVKNHDYKLGRNQFVVTTSKEPKTVRDLTLANMSKLAKVKEDTMLPKETRKDPKKLLKALGEIPAVKAAKPKKAKVNTKKAEKVFDDMVSPHAETDLDINSVMREAGLGD